METPERPGSENGTADQGAHQAYWNQLVLLKTVACYVGRYRDEPARWISRMGLFKALVTSATIGAWATCKDYAFAWPIRPGATQALDAAKDPVPQNRHRRNASEFVSVLGRLLRDRADAWTVSRNGKRLTHRP